MAFHLMVPQWANKSSVNNKQIAARSDSENKNKEKNKCTWGQDTYEEGNKVMHTAKKKKKIVLVKEGQNKEKV
jgi:hypothetical protein